MNDWEVVIGLEVHAELLTKSKLFCGCVTEFGAEPNTHVCPICMGLPGALPVLNGKAVEYTIKAGLAMDCEIPEFSKFDRKNYFYPDLPKAYQVSQYDLPLCQKGSIDITTDAGTRRIGITRIHLEEEAGKSVHSGDNILGSDSSLIDYNRAGIPLIEIVSEPDMRSPEEARLYLERLKAILQYTEVSDCKMQEGSLRCDANISIRPKGAKEFGVKSEVKNLNSFKAVQRALEYEVRRQIAQLEAGESLIQDTRHWDEPRGVTVQMRVKEGASDYRYFPEPDLVPMVIDREWVDSVRQAIPELPEAKRQRFLAEYGLPDYDARLITESKSIADFFEGCVEQYKDAKAVSNWVMGELLRMLNESGQEIEDTAITPGHLVELLGLIDDGTISGKIAKDIFAEMFTSGKRPAAIVDEKGLRQISDEGELEAIVEGVLTENPQSVSDYRDGKKQAIGYLVGQVMKATKGKANPGKVNQLLRSKLEE